VSSQIRSINKMRLSSQNTTVRFTRLIIAGIFVGTLLIGCGTFPLPGANSTPPSQTQPSAASSKPSSENISTPVPSATIPVELSNLKGSEIKIVHPWSGESADVVRDLITKFNQNNVWGIKVTEVVGGSTSETARMFVENMKTSDGMDIVVVPPEYLAVWNNEGNIIDLNPYLSNNEWGIQNSEKDNFLPQSWNSNTVKNGQIGIPTQINLQFLVYNRTWATELGFNNAPQTQDEFKEQVCAAAHASNFDNQKENDGTGGWIINSSSQTILSWINAFNGSKAWTSDSSIVLNQDETGEAFSYLRNLYENGCAWNSRVASPFNYFADRQVLAFSATLPDLMELEKTLAFTKQTDEWLILPYPGKTGPSPVIMTGLSYGISKSNPTNELASWLFLRWMMLPRHQARLAEASGSIPAARSAVELMKDFANSHSWWQAARNLVGDAHMVPSTPAWRQVRPVLEDSFWQMLQPTPLPIPTLLEQMDKTIKSLP
jgi:multiple sugar transport system substrate-binding protein